MSRYSARTRAPHGQRAGEPANDDGEARALEHRDALDLDHDPGPREVRDGEKRARGIAALGKALAAKLHEPVAVPRIEDEHGHGDEVRERAARALERAVHELENGARLLLEFAADVAPV